MMQATDFWNWDDHARARRLGWPSVGCVLVEREMSAGPVIVGEVAGQGAAQVSFAQEEDVQVSGGNGEEVDRDEVPDMVGEERSPGLRREWAALREQPRDGALGQVDAEFQQLTVDSRRTP